MVGRLVGEGYSLCEKPNKKLLLKILGWLD